MIDVNTPIIYIHDYDFVRVDELIRQVVAEKKVFEWNPVTGVTDFQTKMPKGFGEVQSLENFLQEKYSEEEAKEKYLVLKEVQDFIEEPKVKTLLSLMSQRRLYDREYDSTIIIVSSVLRVPQEIEKYVSYLEMDFPNEEEINRLIDEHIEVNFYDKSKFKEEDREKLMPSLKGMTAFEIDRMLDMAMSSNGSLSAEDTEMILRQKKEVRLVRVDRHAGKLGQYWRYGCVEEVFDEQSKCSKTYGRCPPVRCVSSQRGIYCRYAWLWQVALRQSICCTL